MKSTIINKAIHFLQEQPNIQAGEFYFLLASFVMYFKSPLKEQSWNTFFTRIENGEISAENGVLMTDEEKNPHLFKSPKLNAKLKQELHQFLFEQLIKTRKSLIKKYTFQSSISSPSIVVIPDIVNPMKNKPTLFPKTYLLDQIKQGHPINELTGHPFAWDVIESIKQNRPIQSLKIKKVPPEQFIDYIQKDISKYIRTVQCCIVCKNKNTNFKSIKDYQTYSFCSLKCIEHWNH